jgi:catechol 2,3-dioxygenase-like lactoylglutathione lyase family enzyme
MAHKSSRRRFIRRAAAAGAAFGAMGVGAPSAQQTGHVRGFDHVALPMANTDAMRAFYKALGFDLVERAGGTMSVYVGDNMINFHLPARWQDKTFTNRAPAAVPPCGDLCFVWEGTVDSLKATLDRAAAKVEVGPVAREGGRRKPGTSIYVRDPDGNLLEFMIYP